MNKKFLLSIFLILNISYSQDPVIEWSYSFGGGEYDHATAIANDADGNIYFAGTFRNDNINIGGITLNYTEWGLAEIFIAKSDENFNIIWAKTIPVSIHQTIWGDFFGSENSINEIVVDSENNLFLVANIDGGSFSIDDNIIPVISSDFSISSKAVLIKLNADGEYIWSYVNDDFEGQGRAKRVRLDNNHIIFLSQSPNTQIQKLDNNGNLIWTTQINNFDGSNIEVDEYSNIYLSKHYGMYYSDITIIYETSNQESIQFDNIPFLLKFDSYGNYLFGKEYTNYQGELGYIHMTISNNSDIFITGYFIGGPNVIFDDITLESTNPFVNQFRQLFIVRYNQNGNIINGNTLLSSPITPRDFKSDMDMNNYIFLDNNSILKLDYNQNIIWNFSPGSFHNHIHYFNYYSNNLFYIGDIGDANGNTDIIIGKINDSQIIYGCTDSNANNYSPIATTDDGSCQYDCISENPQGCINVGCGLGEICLVQEQDCIPSSCNCDESIGDWICTNDCEGGSCVDVIFGCTYENAINYNSIATIDNGSCQFSDLTMQLEECITDLLDCQDSCEGDINNDNTVNVVDIIITVGIILSDSGGVCE